MKCRICNNDDGLMEYKIREMMLGLREIFSYYRCPVCGCLQIADIPQDLEKYYPSSYYSYINEQQSQFGLKKLLKIQRDKYVVFNKGITGKLLSFVFPDEELVFFAGIDLKSRILDVGCGSGKLLNRLRELGFESVFGVDPYIDSSLEYPNGVRVEKKKLSDLNEKWDVIMFNHSFEHVSSPHEEISHVADLLNESGLCIIRTPVIDSFAWDFYKTDWVQIDAPRHLHIYSVESIKLLAEKVNLYLARIYYDSGTFQFWGSEQYKNDIALNDEKSFSRNRGKSLFSRHDIRTFRKKSIELNRNNFGDQAVFFLKKDTSDFTLHSC